MKRIGKKKIEKLNQKLPKSEFFKLVKCVGAVRAAESSKKRFLRRFKTNKKK